MWPKEAASGAYTDGLTCLVSRPLRNILLLPVRLDIRSEYIPTSGRLITHLVGNYIPRRR